jgi:spermidine/putrescine transport system permease protein
MNDLAISPRGRIGLWILFGAFIAFLYSPIAILVLFSFNAAETPTFPIDGLTTRWYREFASNPELTDALRTSGLVAVVSAVIAVALGLAAALVLARRRFPGKAAASGLLLSPLVMPYVVLGVALLVLFHKLSVETGVTTVIAGHAVLCLPYAILVLLPRLEKVDRRLEEAARDLGAGGVRTFRLVTLPLIAPALMSAFLISFTISFDEYAVASFLVGESPTFPVYLYSQLRFPSRQSVVIAVAVVVMTLSLLVVLAAEIGRRVLERRYDAASEAART